MQTIENAKEGSMKIVISGASGLVGGALCKSLSSQGHEVIKLVRRDAGPGSIKWDPNEGKLDGQQLEGCDAVINLAGEPVAQRWNDEIKAKIKESRVKATKLLADTISGLKNPPKVFISASAIGYYGDKGDATVTESSSVGLDFLSEVCRAWEEATSAASNRGIRTVNLRIGVALSPKGGALAKMLPPFMMGGGGILGTGRQYMSWVSLDDLVGVVNFALQNESVKGPVNVVAPNPVTNAEFTKVLGKVIGRPTIFPVPAFGLKLLFGQMAEEMLLTGSKVLPEKLESAGYKFQYPTLEPALKHALQN